MTSDIESRLFEVKGKINYWEEKRNIANYYLEKWYKKKQELELEQKNLKT